MPQAFDIPLGWPLPKRKKFLDELVKNKHTNNNYPLRFQNKPLYFPVYIVEIDLPKYRLSNGRTQAVQEEYLATHPNLSPNFFILDQEFEEAQFVQHTLLWAMVKNTKLLSYFEDITHSQEQPLILTDKGFIVNGNRRLCAMRELFYKVDQEKYSRYSHVDVIVLPFCDDRDIDELEAYLQIQPDIKQDYTWIALACMLRARQQRYGYTHQQLSVLYDIPEREIQSRLTQLDLVDEYLNSRGKPKQYDTVEKADYAFKQLYKGKQQLKQPDQKDLFTQLTYCFLDDSNAAEGRLYERIPEIKENLDKIADCLTEELKPEPSPISSLSDVDTSVFGVEVKVSNLQPIIQAVSKPENREIIVENVLDVLDGQKEKEKQRTKANAVMKQVSEANAHLKNAINYIVEDTSKLGIEEQLRAIEESIKINPEVVIVKCLKFITIKMIS